MEIEIAEFAKTTGISAERAYHALTQDFLMGVAFVDCSSKTDSNINVAELDRFNKHGQVFRGNL